MCIFVYSGKHGRDNDQGGKMDDTEFRMVVLASMLKEWMIFISTLGTYTTSTEVIAQIMAHNSMLALGIITGFKTHAGFG